MEMKRACSTYVQEKKKHNNSIISQILIEGKSHKNPVPTALVAHRGKGKGKEKSKKDNKSKKKCSYCKKKGHLKRNADN